ncbi:MAG: hypothetical protein LC130_23175 [Bryobacterales bacterium]|nr:hypothetical protein [Bryobacterales bacterium]MCZ2077892.1 hypothetical protein [Bryobacterales bacterium]
MASIAGAQALYRALAGTQRDVGAALQAASDRIGGAIQRNAGRDGRVPVERLQDVTETGDGAIDEAFIGPNKRPFASDGVTAQAPIPRALNRGYALAVFGVIAGHSSFIKAHTPDSVQTWLAGAVRPQAIVGFEGMHTWVDSNGLILSDRIWQAGIRTRLKLRGLLADGIRQGTSATTLASRVEQFLLPDRAPIKTRTPYGSSGSYDARRLARTEVSRAHAQATRAASLHNPYVEGLDWALSPSHPRMDICDDKATIGMSGERIRPAYPVDSAPTPPAHPHCLCRSQSFVGRSPSDVADELQISMAAGEDAPFTPVDADRFVELLIGVYLLNLLQQELVRQ